MLDDQQTRAVLEIALMAAFADGLNDDRERTHLQQVAEACNAGADFDFPALYRDVLLGKRDPAAAAGALDTPQARQLAYEMAVGVCDADGTRNERETAFLTSLATSLGIGAAQAGAFAAKADDVAAAAEVTAAGAVTTAGAGAPQAPAGAARTPSTTATTELDQTILNHSITAAALELLPDSLANLAVIPVQLKLVHRIGQAHGYPMDTSQAKDFLAVLGVGLTSQYLEGFARKLLGGVFRGLGGRAGGVLGRQAASSGLAFATTYAIGKVAHEYYTAGRTLDAARLKALYEQTVGSAQALAGKYTSEIQTRAQGIDTKQIGAWVRSA